MRLADFIQVFEPYRDERSAGVTIDVAAGIVAGLALVLALLLLSATLKTNAAQAGEVSGRPAAHAVLQPGPSHG